MALEGELAEATKWTEGDDVAPFRGAVVTTSANDRDEATVMRTAKQSSFFDNDLLLVKVKTTKERQNASNRLRNGRAMK
jgi:hypothetical protein